MALVAGYSSDEDEDYTGPSVSGASTSKPGPSKIVQAAPEVSLEDPMQLKQMLVKPSDKQLSYNISYSDMTRPLAGPVNPFKSATQVGLKKNTLTGYAEAQEFSEAAFRTQSRTFQAHGYAKNPSVHTSEGPEFIGDVAKAAEMDGQNIVEIAVKKKESAALRKTREKRGDPSVLDGKDAYKGPWAPYLVDKTPSPEPEELLSGEEYEEDSIQPVIHETKAADDTSHEKTEFNGPEEYDYMGRSRIMHVPQDLDVNLLGEQGEKECFIPKKLIHTWSGHHKGVTCVRLFPRSGHMMLSGGNDNKIKIWDVYHERELMRTYSGHFKAVHDLSFQPLTGSTFLSAAFDRMIKLWDTETGQVIARWDTGALPYCIRFNPTVEHQHEFLAGLSNKKILQYDVRSGEIVQEYDHHLAAINTITFCDEDKRFISTSDDKSLRAWEYGINVPIKYIAEPDMHSLVKVALHPNGKHIAAQSLNNTIQVFGATDRFRAQRKKVFSGHRNAGFQPDVAFSPDGKWLSSGDAGGYACFWDWKTTRLYHKMKAHETVCSCIVWQPHETSRVITAGWDGFIKYWD